MTTIYRPEKQTDPAKMPGQIVYPIDADKLVGGEDLKDVTHIESRGLYLRDIIARMIRDDDDFYSESSYANWESA